MMNKWDNIQNRTEVNFIVDSILKKVKDKKVKRFFSFEEIILKKENNVYSETTLEGPIYILFEDNDCIILDFSFYFIGNFILRQKPLDKLMFV